MTVATSSDTALYSLIQRLADNKYWLGRRYAEWCTSAPTLESAVAASAMAQDEIGHARSHYPLFRQFAGHDVEPETRGVFRSMSILDQPFRGWFDFVAANFLVDTALTTLYEAAWDSSYVDLRTRARRIVGEEQVHWLHGQAWVKRLARESEATKASLYAALKLSWGEVLMWFGPPLDQDADHLVESGYVHSAPDELRGMFRNRVDPILRSAGLALSVKESLPWDRWDHDRYRLPAAET